MNHLIERIVRLSRKTRLRSAQKQILRTGPLKMKESTLNFLSMVSHRDVVPYICAIKSVYRFAREGKVTVIDDGSLTPADRARILRHVPACVFLHIGDIDTGDCPRGGTWERLVQISHLVATDYVVQVDADTLALDAIPEVMEAFTQNRSFLLGTDLGQEFGSVADVHALVSGFGVGRDKVGCVAEMALSQLPGAASLRYARGSSGFAGFARGSITFDGLQAFARGMEPLLGPRWTEWGTEQVASNFMIANSRDAVVLPYLKYSCFEPWIDTSTRCFLHFYGTYRLDKNIYRHACLDLVKHYRERHAS